MGARAPRASFLTVAPNCQGIDGWRQGDTHASLDPQLPGGPSSGTLSVPYPPGGGSTSLRVIAASITQSLTPTRCAGVGASLSHKMLYHNKPVDFASQESAQERRIVTQRYAAIRLTGGAEHIRMRKHPIPTKHPATVDRDKANGANAVEKSLAQCEIVNVGRRWPLPLRVDVSWIVQVITQAGMSFQPVSIG